MTVPNFRNCAQKAFFGQKNCTEKACQNKKTIINFNSMSGALMLKLRPGTYPMKKVNEGNKPLALELYVSKNKSKICSLPVAVLLIILSFSE
jgi:hypothetical protein